MAQKKILGLDLGTNSIGWAVVSAEEAAGENRPLVLQPKAVISAGSRIIPMDEGRLGDFDKGNSVSQTAERTESRMARRIHERSLLRRERLLRVLGLMGFLPPHYAGQIDRHGKFVGHGEPKLAWRRGGDGRMEFLFMESFHEMLRDFAEAQPQLVADGRRVPLDWTVYYLRKKALTQPVGKQELAWLLMQFNQKRGYYQLRGEDDGEKDGKRTEYVAQKVVRVEPTDEKAKDGVWYNVHLENGMVYRRTSKTPFDWTGELKEFIVTTTINDDGTEKLDKDGSVKRSIRLPNEDDWMLLKKKTEHDIDNSGKTVGCYIYDTLLQHPDQKIIGKLVRTVERRYYKDELQQILNAQKAFIPELRDEELYRACLEELYPHNEAHRSSMSNPDFTRLFVDDILFYQRPLRSKKSLIDNCPYESRWGRDGQGNIESHAVKCIARSNPLYQEFRLWQFVQNLRIYQREGNDGEQLRIDVDVTDQWLKSTDDYVRLFDWLNKRKSVKQETLLKSYFNMKKDSKTGPYPCRWNYVEDKEYPCNETRAGLLDGLKQCGLEDKLLTHESEMWLWHILYSVDDRYEIEKALGKYAVRRGLDESKFVKAFSRLKPFEKNYGAYSEKAVKKLLALMRMGKYWSKEGIDSQTRERIEKIITGEYDEHISDRVREKSNKLTEIGHFSGLPLWLACYVVYGRHSETKDNVKWDKPEDIDRFLHEKFRQHMLRNPIVEQVVVETLRTVRDVWRQEGQIDEIHVELGREMKNPADKRKRMAENIRQNENTNLRIKAMLMEFKEMGEFEDVRPYSPSQQEILKIYEEGAIENLKEDDENYDLVKSVSTKAQPSKSEIEKYKCWLEQKYRSPYTGEFIQFSRLFTKDYEIEHIIPQSRYFDDSFSNKVICESEVNKLKDRQLGYEFIEEHHGEKVTLSKGKVVEILSVDAYENLVKQTYNHDRTRSKMKKLLMKDIPDAFIERQLNDSRYISRYVTGLLSNIVRQKQADGEYEPETVSKNLILCNGAITDRLKKDWGINDVWNSIVLPRFRRLNELTGKDCFTTRSNEGHEIPAMPLELQKGFNKKRIDHRHHAMDAIVIACTTRDHVNLLNNEAAHSKHNANRYQLQRKLRRYEKTVINGKERDVAKEFLKPWETFPADARQVLENIVVSFKQNLRVINNSANHYQHYDEAGKKVLVKQTRGNNLAIRKQMHKETFFGEVNLRKTKEVRLSEALKSPDRIVDKEFKSMVSALLRSGHDEKHIKAYVERNRDVWADIDLKKIEVYYFTQEEKKDGEVRERYFATRKSLDSSFDEKKIEKITDTGIRKILLAHLQRSGGKADVAFSPEGIEKMNRDIVSLNDGRFHQPILKMRVYEKADKFAVGTKGNKSTKFVEAAAGTNLFFAVFEAQAGDAAAKVDTMKKRTYLTIPLRVMIDCQKLYGNHWRDHIEAYLQEIGMSDSDSKLLFILSPNDLVYLPTEEELKTGICSMEKDRIYKMVSCAGVMADFVPASSASTLFSVPKKGQKERFGNENFYKIQDEYGMGSPKSKNERAITGEMIKEICIPIKVDRLGNIIEVGR